MSEQTKMPDDASPDGLTEIVPGIAVSGRVRRVLYEGNPREPDYKEAQQAAQAIRSDLARIRHRLRMLQRIETDFDPDSQALHAAGAVHCAIVTLAELALPGKGFDLKAEQSREIWADAAANPDSYVIEPGSRGHGRDEWKWRDWNWEPGRPKRDAPSSPDGVS